MSKKAWKERPYLQDSQDELLHRLDQSPDDLAVLINVLYELQYRRFVPGDVKAKIFDRLIQDYQKRVDSSFDLLTLILKKQGSIPPKPDIGSFDTEIKEARHRNREDKAWREIGILKSSGYTVGINSDVSRTQRHRILNHLFLVDDLSDIDDLTYAEEWGAPLSGERLKKMADSISSFIKNCKRKHDPSYDLAIREWEDDLSYIKNTFYDEWYKEFPWPGLDV